MSRPRIVRAVQQRCRLVLGEVRFQIVQAPADLGRLGLVLFGQVEQFLEVVELPLELLPESDLF